MDLSLEQMKSEAALALENLKIQNERRRRTFEEASQTSAPIEASLDQAWHDIQTVKEVIARLLAPSRYDKDIALYRRPDFSEQRLNPSQAHCWT